MKRIVLVLLMFVFCASNAQNFVTTESQNRNVIIEEYTGKHCSWCPEGQMTANAIARNNPGKVFLLNIHGGPFSPPTEPNLNTDDGTTMVEDYGVTAYPAGFVNRTSMYEIAREQWSSYTLQQLQQTAECNVDGQVIINPTTREATITVEIYYTASSNESFNYLTIAMLQDSIIGDQDGGSANPEQYVNGQYRHMHILRDMITSTWGDVISPTTAGTLITKTYNYTIPEIIGDPNGVEVVIENISFLAYVSEGDDGIQTCPVLNVNELITIIDNDKDVNPMISKAYQKSLTSCSEQNVLCANIINAGKQEITSLLIKVSTESNAEEFLWEGNLKSYHEVMIESDIDLSAGNGVKVEILEVNGEEYHCAKNVEMITDEWQDVELVAGEETLTIEVAQDKYGNQTRWFVITADYDVLASGGPYQMLSEPGTELHQVELTVKGGDCFKFIITDAGGNGICCNNGDGYYRIMNSNGDVIVDGGGDFGAEKSHLLSMKYNGTDVEEIDETAAMIYPNPTQGELVVECDAMKELTVIMPNGQVVERINVNGDKYLLDMSDYNSGVYYVKITTKDNNVITYKSVKM